MTIDLLEARHNIEMLLSNTVTDTVNYVTSVDFSMIYGVSLGTMFGILGIEAYRRWRKGKGLRMALKQEKLRLREKLSMGLTNMICDWEADGSVSHQEGDALFNELSKKLDLPDLIPRQRRYEIVKNEIKARLRSPKHQVKKPNIPGGSPAVPVKPKTFRQSTGNLISRFWKTK